MRGALVSPIGRPLLVCLFLLESIVRARSAEPTRGRVAYALVRPARPRLMRRRPVSEVTTAARGPGSPSTSRDAGRGLGLYAAARYSRSLRTRGPNHGDSPRVCPCPTFVNHSVAQS